MDIGERIKLRRKELGYSLQEAGDRVGSTASTFRKWEAGEIANMGVDKVKKVAKALDVTPAYLMGWEEKNTPNTETSVEGIDLTQSEEEIIKLLRQMDKEQIIQAILALQKIISDQNGGKGQ